MHKKGETLRQKSKRLPIDLPRQNDVRENPVYINNKKNLPRFNVSLQPVHSYSIQNFQILFNILRCTSLDKREYSKFRDFIMKLHSEQKTATLMTYLPPVQTPITKYETLFEMFRKSHDVAKKTKVKYAHIILDVGANIKAYHLIWNYQEKWKNVIIHLGDFHDFLAFSRITGKYIKCSGFEDIVYQAKFYSPGSLNAVLTDKHHNRCWWVHENFSEAFERLFIKTYL